MGSRRGRKSCSEGGCLGRTAHVLPVDRKSLWVGRGLALCFLGRLIKNWDLEILKFRSQCLGQLRASGARAGLETPFRNHQQMEAI